jgi:HD-like signal output (HDOD) protein
MRAAGSPALKKHRAVSEDISVHDKRSPVLERERILDILARAPDILTLPTIIHEIMEVISRKSSSATDLTAIIESDPALTARILTVANSPYYGFVKKISNVTHAIVVLGFQEIQNIALSMSVLQMFDRKGSEFSEQLWRHCFSVGVGTRMVGKYLNLKVDGTFFVSGLLHDVGKIFVSQYLAESFHRILSAMGDEGNLYGYHALEERILGITHQEVGQILLGSWMFPPDVREAVAFHHDPAASQGSPLLAACVHLADVLCTARGITPVKDHHFVTVNRSVLPVIQEFRHSFGTEDMVSLMGQLDIEIDRQGSFLSVFRKH